MKLYRIGALLLKYWYVTINSVDRIFDVWFWPVFSLVLWGFTASFVKGLTKTDLIVNIFIGGIILWLMFDRAQKDVAVYILEDFWNRNVYNIYTTPVTEGELFVSTALLGLLRATASFVGLFAVALVGYSFNILEI